MPVHEFKCKGKMPNGDGCPLTVSYEYDPVIIKMDKKEVVYLTCDNKHTCRYEIG